MQQYARENIGTVCSGKNRLDGDVVLHETEVYGQGILKASLLSPSFAGASQRGARCGR